MEEINPPLEDDAFVVKESQSVNIIIGVVMLSMIAFMVASETSVTI